MILYLTYLTNTTFGVRINQNSGPPKKDQNTGKQLQPLLMRSRTFLPTCNPQHSLDKFRHCDIVLAIIT